MMHYTKYGPYVCIGVVLSILFVLWAFCGGKNYEFVGLAPLDPNTCGSYTGSIYNWGNITPADNCGPIAIQDFVPSDTVCQQDSGTSSEPIPVVDNTPLVPEQFHVTNDQMSFIEELPIVLNSELEDLVTVTKSSINRSNCTQPPKRKGRFISRGERLCCQTMENIYGVPFSTVRPDWLSNPETGRNLELDCYNSELQIAVEYNGEQHYKWPNFTNQTYQQFIDQVRRDSLKMNLCDRNGVYLIVVPYNVPHDKISSYIISHLPETIQKRIHEEKTLTCIA
jgi:hypothetical protein